MPADIGDVLPLAKKSVALGKLSDDLLGAVP